MRDDFREAFRFKATEKEIDKLNNEHRKWCASKPNRHTDCAHELCRKYGHELPANWCVWVEKDEVVAAEVLL
jgi:hypothetical protein